MQHEAHCNTLLDQDCMLRPHLGFLACSHSSSGSCLGRMPGSLHDVMSSMLPQNTGRMQLQHQTQSADHASAAGAYTHTSDATLRNVLTEAYA